jgi:hypothetical protein
MRRENIHQRGCYFKEVSEAMRLIAVSFKVARIRKKSSRYFVRWLPCPATQKGTETSFTNKSLC